nr:MAG TPA: hypothetical protein [Caudoviricetes sp.]
MDVKCLKNRDFQFPLRKLLKLVNSNSDKRK